MASATLRFNPYERGLREPHRLRCLLSPTPPGCRLDVQPQIIPLHGVDLNQDRALIFEAIMACLASMAEVGAEIMNLPLVDNHKSTDTCNLGQWGAKGFLRAPPEPSAFCSFCLLKELRNIFRLTCNPARMKGNAVVVKEETKKRAREAGAMLLKSGIPAALTAFGDTREYNMINDSPRPYKVVEIFMTHARTVAETGGDFGERIMRKAWSPFTQVEWSLDLKPLHHARAMYKRFAKALQQAKQGETTDALAAYINEKFKEQLSDTSLTDLFVTLDLEDLRVNVSEFGRDESSLTCKVLRFLQAYTRNVLGDGLGSMSAVLLSDNLFTNMLKGVEKKEMLDFVKELTNNFAIAKELGAKAKLLTVHPHVSPALDSVNLQSLFGEERHDVTFDLKSQKLVSLGRFVLSGVASEAPLYIFVEVEKNVETSFNARKGLAVWNDKNKTYEFYDFLSAALRSRMEWAAAAAYPGMQEAVWYLGPRHRLAKTGLSPKLSGGRWPFYQNETAIELPPPSEEPAGRRDFSELTRAALTAKIGEPKGTVTQVLKDHNAALYVFRRRGDIVRLGDA